MKKTALVLITVLSLLSPGLARADVQPSELCSVEGQACNNARDYAAGHWDQPGICGPSTCDRGLIDGGTEPYTCLKCLIVDAGAASDAGDDGGSDGGADNGGGSGGKKGCSLGPVPIENAAPGIVLLAGIALLAIRPGRKR